MTDFSFPALEPAAVDIVASRRPRATIEVIAGFLRAWVSTSVATKPVEPPITSFMVINCTRSGAGIGSS